MHRKDRQSQKSEVSDLRKSHFAVFFEQLSLELTKTAILG